jgi:hypothetical protein
MSGVRLQSEYWKSKFWVPDSEVVFAQPLRLFPNYRHPQPDYDYFIKPTNSHHTDVNFDQKETNVSRDFDNIGSWFKYFGKEVQNGDVRSHEQNEKSKNNEYETATYIFNNITWDTEHGKGRVGNHRNDLGLNISEYQLNDKNRVASQSIDLDMMGNLENDLNISVKRTSLFKQKEHRGERNRNYSDIRPVERQFSESSPIIMRQQDGPSIEGHRHLGLQKSVFVANEPSDHSGHSTNTARQEVNEEKRDGNLQSIYSVEGNRFSGFDTNREKQGFGDKIVRGRYSFESNRLRDKIWQSDLDTGRNPDGKFLSAFDTKRGLHNIIAWNGDSGRSDEEEDGTRSKSDWGKNNFGYWQSQSGSNSEAEVSSYRKDYNRRFNADRWYSGTGTGEEGLRNLGENLGGGNVQNSYYSVKNSFGDVWLDDTDAITEGQHTSRGKQPNVQNIFDSEEHSFDEVKWQNNYHTPTEEYEPGQDEFNIQRHRFGDVTLGSEYSSESEYLMPDFNQEHGFDSSRNRFSGTSWQSDYSLERERQRVAVYAESDGELVKNQYIGANIPFHHGGHPTRVGTRVATGPPTAVTSYILPNGTKVVRLRRIVLYKKLQTSPDEESPRTFASIAKGILQKKVAKCMYSIHWSTSKFNCMI